MPLPLAHLSLTLSLSTYVYAQSRFYRFRRVLIIHEAFVFQTARVLHVLYVMLDVDLAGHCLGIPRSFPSVQMTPNHNTANSIPIGIHSFSLPYFSLGLARVGDFTCLSSGRVAVFTIPLSPCSQLGLKGTWIPNVLIVLLDIEVLNPSCALTAKPALARKWQWRENPESSDESTRWKIASLLMQAGFARHLVYMQTTIHSLSMVVLFGSPVPRRRSGSLIPSQ